MGQGELDPGSLTKDPEKIKILMRRDPKFITRLISVGFSSLLVMLVSVAGRRETNGCLLTVRCSFYPPIPRAWYRHSNTHAQHQNPGPG